MIIILPIDTFLPLGNFAQLFLLQLVTSVNTPISLIVNLMDIYSLFSAIRLHTCSHTYGCIRACA